MIKQKYSRDAFSTVLKMAIPSIIESFFVAFAGLVDSLMVSGLGSDAVAAVGLTTQPKFIGLAIFIAISVSLSALVARRVGEKRRHSANEIFLTAFGIVIILAIIISLAFVIFADDIIRMCGSEEATHDYAVTYLRIIMGGIIFNCIQITVNAAQRGAGNTKITMRTNVVSNVINMIFNYLLIEGKFGFPALGIHGAAIATVFGSFIATIMSILSVSNTKVFVSFPYIFKQRIKPTIDAFLGIIKVGYSVFFEQILLRIGFLATALMAADQGSDPMAAHQVGMNIMGLSFAFGDGLQAAAVALIGRSLGEKDPDKAKLYGRTCQFVGGCISVVLAIVYFIGARFLMELFFPKDPDIVDIGIYIIYLIIVSVLFQLRQVIYMGCLRGAGDTLFTAVVSAVCVTVIRTVVSFTTCYNLGFGIHGIWIGVIADQCARFILAAIRFSGGKWVNIKI